MTNIVCPRCGRATAKGKPVTRYEYRESGLEGLYLHGGVTKVTCPCDPDPYFRIEKEGQLLQVIALALLMKPAPLNGSEQRFLRSACRLTQARLADLLKGPRRETIAERERSSKPLSPAEDFWLRVVLVQEFHALLLEPGQSQLSPKHVEDLIDFQKSLAPFARAIEDKLRKKSMTLSLVQGELWSMETAA
jgi:hypothetical protein